MSTCPTCGQARPAGTTDTDPRPAGRAQGLAEAQRRFGTPTQQPGTATSPRSRAETP